MTSPVASLYAGPPGTIRLWSQARLEPSPKTNCRFYALAQALWWAGLRWPSGEVLNDLITLMRRATGVPEVDPRTGESQGTTAADVERAVAKVLPWVRIDSRLWADAELWQAVAEGRVYANIAASPYSRLPTRQRRWSPSFTGGHMLGFGKARNPRGAWSNPQVLLLDPMGYGEYDGDWVEWRDIRPAMATWGAFTFATTLEVTAAVNVTIGVEQAFASPAQVDLPAGDIAVYAMTAQGDFNRSGSFAVPRGGVSYATDLVAVVERRPDEPPQGRFVRLVTGPLAGKYIRRQDVGTIAVPVAPDIAKIEAAAFERGRIAERAEYTPYPAESVPPLYTKRATDVPAPGVKP